METFYFRSRLVSPFFLLAAVMAASLMSGCGNVGSSPTSPTGPELQGNTQVVILLSSTANDLWSNYNLSISNISLSNQTGNQVTLFNPSLTSGEFFEFAHLNSLSEPLPSVSTPQGVYTSASITYWYPSIGCLTVSSIGGVQYNTYAVATTGNFGPFSVTINFPSPITISGTAMALSLDLQISQSTSLSGCVVPPTGTVATFTVNPVFTLSPVSIISQPTNDSNGKETGITGRVVSVDEAGGTFTLQTATGSDITGGAGTPLIFSADASTTYQGIGGLSELLVGMFVDMDAEIQADGSLLATRVEVQDTTATNMWIGPLVSVFVPQGNIQAQGEQEQGDDLSANPITENYYSFDVNTAFKISGQYSSPTNLPFTPAFNTSTMFAGQNVAIASGAIPLTAPTYARATTITLMPQTLNGTITALSSSGAFQVYTVGLASYDPIPTLIGVVGQSTSLTNPNSVQVYVTGSTQMLNSSPLSAGNIARFQGLLFNDGGTLRMVCLQVNDGVTE